MISIQYISWGLDDEKIYNSIKGLKKKEKQKNNGNDIIKFEEEYLKQKRNGK